ncbi:hypothetical protein PF005_g27091 [Phytophthora fragariae]|nr:hypothetical protein PF003_g14617 [Phytophthora fragariae]KAE8922784.1 hypothetical protein PF009_g26956 [Phytophthora fragariae]KAE8973618.1 hypothetical protein PF011_g25179 [Phytophthora fragariae]KAE9069539.1 hypothetical protein PF010_g26623 [Phytophthora fragariae]KAE9072183.1 hypothetical protein PF007_g26273 [Phytophthora fragariae]
MTTLTNLIDATSERSSYASSDERPPAKRRRHLTTGSEQDRERERKRKEASVERNYDEVIQLSKALQAAVAALKALKECHATPEQVEGAEFVVNS